MLYWFHKVDSFEHCFMDIVTCGCLLARTRVKASTRWWMAAFNLRDLQKWSEIDAWIKTALSCSTRNAGFVIVINDNTRNGDPGGINQCSTPPARRSGGPSRASLGNKCLMETRLFFVATLNTRHKVATP